jgi:urea transport system permease protein
MNQPLMLTAAQKAGPKVTVAQKAAKSGAVVLVVLLAMPLLLLLSGGQCRCTSRPTP